MYSEENYFWGLVGYYLGVLLVLAPLWRITRPLPGFPLRALARVAVITLLATPMFPYRDLHYLAPAWGVMLFDAIGPERGDALLRGVLPLLAVFGLLYVMTLGVWLTFRRRRNATSTARKRTTTAKSAAAPAPRSGRREPTFAQGPAPESLAPPLKTSVQRRSGGRVGSDKRLP
ncbi:MAG: hypothetical protein AB7I68_13840 [Porticoccaceae bacterium]